MARMNRIAPQTTPFSTNGPTPQVKLEANQEVPNLKATASITLTYHPDRSIINPAHFKEWLYKTATNHTHASWEAFSTCLLDNFYDALLPKEVTLTLNIPHENGSTQHISLTQKQP